MPDGGIEKCTHEDICSLEGLRDMAAAAVRCGVKKIRVTGGEPLVRRGAVDFCRMLSEIPGVEELCVTTNGSLLKEFARPLRDAGVTHLNISLDTLNEARFRAITRLGTLQDTLDGIEAAERAGFAKIKLNCVLLGGVGEVLQRRLETSRRAVVLVKPAEGVSTAAAYQRFDETPCSVSAEVLAHDFAAARADDVAVANNLAPAAEVLLPELADIRAWLADQVGEANVLLSGSGSVTFALVDTFAEASRITTAATAHG